VKFDKIGSILKNLETGHYEIGPLSNGLGGPYTTATEYYRAWAAANISKHGATSDFPSRIAAIASMISENDNGPFRLIHPDFGHNNIIVDDDFNMLSVIDWEYSIVGPSELAARFPIRLQMYPEAILPQKRDANGRIVDEAWRRLSENRDHWVKQVVLHESSSCDALRLSSSMFGVRADIVFMIRMWEERMPWMYTYQAGVKEGLDTIKESLRQAKERA
jgi:Choline/ethanolamine kinase